MKINPLNSISLQQQTETKKVDQESTGFQKALEKAQKSGDPKALQSACKQFESVFANMLLKNMRNTITDGGLTEKSHAREMFEGMLDEKIAEEVAKGEGMGLAKMMYEQLSKNFNSENKDSDK